MRTLTISDKARALLALDNEIQKKCQQRRELQAAIIVLQEQESAIHRDMKLLEEKANLILTSGS